MKIIIQITTAIVTVLLPLFATAQCKPSKSYITFPTFLSLYFRCECFSGSFSDTIICARFGANASGRLPYFSASSPIGNIGTVTATPNEIYPTNDSVDVSYHISGGLIDNFCPYAFVLNTLSVDFCGINAESDGQYIAVQWATCSNQNTSHFNVVISGDLNTWSTARSIESYYTNSSDLSIYKTKFPYKAGLWYVRVIEVDLNGDKTLSDVVKVSVHSNSTINTIDLSGRETGKPTFQWLAR
jgi:hypothetical protein